MTHMTETYAHTARCYEYRGSTIEVRKHLATKVEKRVYGGPVVLWTYYLYLDLSRFTDTELARSLWLPVEHGQGGRAYWDYCQCDFLVHLPWHGGLTWYNKHILPSGGRVIEVGCDYGHQWDQNHRYVLADVLADAKATVDALHEATTYLCEPAPSHAMEAKLLAKEVATKPTQRRLRPEA